MTIAEYGNSSAYSNLVMSYNRPYLVGLSYSLSILVYLFEFDNVWGYWQKKKKSQENKADCELGIYWPFLDKCFSTLIDKSPNAAETLMGKLPFPFRKHAKMKVFHR